MIQGLTISKNDNETVLAFSGRLDAVRASRLFKPATRQIKESRTGRMVFDFKEMEYLDTSGAAFIAHIRDQAQDLGFETVQIKNLASENSDLLDLAIDIREKEGNRPSLEHLSLVEKTGRDVSTAVSETREFITYIGRITWALLQSLKHPVRIRWANVLYTAENSGVNALPIVALISFIVGLVMAFQAAIPMRMFGAEIYVANLIGIAMVRELGPLMTAIVLAGRSSSAFAAEIGTMRINEEIDALTIMGLDPFQFLIVPRIIATTFITPLLTIFSNLIGILGGALVIISLGHPFVSYYNQIAGFVKWTDFAGGLVKCFVFGILIAATGCIRGYQTQSGPSAVGDSTTRAVVTSIILIAVFDGIFSIVYYCLGI